MVTKSKLVIATLSTLILGSLLFSSLAQTDVPFQRDTTRGDDSFDLTEKEVARRVNAVETRIANCMAENGFEYYPVDYATIRAALDLAGEFEYGFEYFSVDYATIRAAMESGSDFIERFGYGISTFYGQQGQIADGQGDLNTQYYQALSEADQVAYDQILYGEDKEATLLVALDSESFARTGGCTREAAEQVFSSEEVSAANFQTDLSSRVDNDRRMIAAYKEWSGCVLEAGYSFERPADISASLSANLEEITANQPLIELSEAQLAELEDLQAQEIDIAAADKDCEEEHLAEIKDEVEKDLSGN